MKHPSPFRRKKGERIMRRYLTPGKALRRFAGVAIAAGTVAAIGLPPTASAQVGAATGSAPASAVAAPKSSVCHWFPLPASLFVGDPAAFYPQLLGNYSLPGQTGVAYKLTGEFAHSTTMTFTAYNSLYDIPARTGYILNDSSIIPDPGSVNPFIPGTRVDAPNRNYTAWLWPNSIPVPAGLRNVILYPTKPALPSQKMATWSLTMRLYHMQPGYRAIAAEPTVTAVSAANPSRPVRCPLTTAFTFPRLFRDFLAHVKVYGPIPTAPEPTTGNKIYITRAPWQVIAGLEGYETNACSNYMVATLPPNQISVITEHAVAPYFNNNLVTPSTIMKDFPIRYQSASVPYAPVEYPAISVNTSNARYTSDGSWVTIYLPNKPRLTPEQIRLVRAAARALDYNVIQTPPKARGPLGKQVPYNQVGWRQKAISPSFPDSVLNMPCWGKHHNYRTWTDQTSPAFFAKYASSPRNMGPYYISGVKLDFPQFMAKFSRK
jgi:hypothetical protein